MSKKITRALSGVKHGRYVLLAAAALSAGCIFDPPPPVVRKPADLYSPDGVLQIIMQSYNQGDVNKYKSTLVNNFVFLFNPQDVGDKVGGYTIPESWTYTEDWTATRNMFEQAYSIVLIIPKVDDPEPGATEFFAGNVNISLTVMTTETEGFITDRGWCNFYFEKQPDDTWRLIRWWDHTTAA